MNRWYMLLAASTALAGCAAPPPPALPAAEAVPVVPAAPEAPPAPKAEIGAFGFDEAGMNRAIAPGDDFYQFGNGTWAKNTTIPSDKSNYGMFVALQDKSQQRVRDLLDVAKDDPASRVGIAYSSFLDEAAVESKGLAPI